MKINPIINFNIPKFNQTRPILWPLKKDTFEKTITSEPAFKGFKCATDNFSPRNLYEMPCASCGKKTLTGKQVDIFARDTREKKGEDLIRALASKRDYYQKIEKRVAEEIAKTALDYPDETIDALIKRASRKHKSQLEKEQIDILKGLKTKAGKLGSVKDTKCTQEFLQTTIKGISRSNGDSYFKRKEFLENLKILGQDFKNKTEFQNLLKAAEKLPTSSDSISAFYVKYSRRSSEEIAKRLVVASLATTEHMLPQSEGGRDDSSNYMVMCGCCNSNRSSKPYSEWLKHHPEMTDNFKKYVDEVIKRIQNKELTERWAGYPSEVCETMKQLTNGAISLSVEGNITALAQKEEPVNKTKTVEERFEKAKTAYEEKVSNVSKLETREKYLKGDVQYQTIIKYYALQKEINGLIERKRTADGELTEIKRKQRNREEKERQLREAKVELKRIEGLHRTRSQEVEELPELVEINVGKKKGSLQSNITGLSRKITTLENALKNMPQSYDGQIIQQQLVCDRLDENINAKSDEKFAALRVFELPETIKEKKQALEETLKSRVAKALNIKKMKDEQAASSELIKQKTVLEEKLQNLGKVKSIIERKANLDDPANSDAIKEYELLVKKRDITMQINTKSLDRFVNTKDGIEAIFLVDEALSSLNGKIGKLCYKNETVHYIDTMSKIKKTEIEFEQIEDIIKKSSQASTIIKLENDLREEESKHSSDDIRKEVDALEREYENIQGKINDITIKDRIKSARRMRDEAYQEFMKMKREYGKALNARNSAI